MAILGPSNCHDRFKGPQPLPNVTIQVSYCYFWKVDLEVVGDEGEVKLVMEDFVLNDWMVGLA